MYFLKMKTYLWKKTRKIAKGKEITESTIFDVHDFPLSLVDNPEIRWQWEVLSVTRTPVLIRFPIVI